MFATSLALTAGAGAAAFATPVPEIDVQTAESGNGCLVRIAHGEQHEPNEMHAV